MYVHSCPIRLIEYALKRWSYPVPAVGAIIALPLLVFFVGLGAFRSVPGFELWERPMGTIGVLLLVILLPSSLLMWFTNWVRTSAVLIADIRSQMDGAEGLEISRYQFAKFWPLALVLGIAFALLANLDLSALRFNPSSEVFPVSMALAFGQIFMWSVVAVSLFFVFLDDWLFYQYGKYVRVSIYNLDSLNSFGSAVLSQFLMVVGALALTTVQSLDREFEWVNYANGLYVGIPSAIIFVILPTWTVRKNIRREKARALAALNHEIQITSTDLDNDSLLRLNGLLARREQVQHTRTWPMDISIFSRFLFYVFIPPLAWLGAALVEVMLDSFLAG